MSKISKSPDRHKFQKEAYLKRCKEKNQEVSPEYLDMLDNIIEEDKIKFKTKESRIDNLEYDLLTTEWILEKVRTSDAYAQNLYAAFCNNNFTKLDVIPILTNKEWGCSWRYAGGIIADMRQEGDYIDWYCSGIRDHKEPSKEEWEAWSAEDKTRWIEGFSKYVPEGMITEEIREDLQRLGWIPAKDGDWEHFE